MLAPESDICVSSSELNDGYEPHAGCGRGPPRLGRCNESMQWSSMTARVATRRLAMASASGQKSFEQLQLVVFNGLDWRIKLTVFLLRKWLRNMMEKPILVQEIVSRLMTQLWWRGRNETGRECRHMACTLDIPSSPNFRFQLWFELGRSGLRTNAE